MYPTFTRIRSWLQSQKVSDWCDQNRNHFLNRCRCYYRTSFSGSCLKPKAQVIWTSEYVYLLSPPPKWRKPWRENRAQRAMHYHQTSRKKRKTICLLLEIFLRKNKHIRSPQMSTVRERLVGGPLLSGTSRRFSVAQTLDFVHFSLKNQLLWTLNVWLRTYGQLVI